MAYDWRPTANRAATTDPAVVALPRHPRPVAAAPTARRAPALASPDDILVTAAIEEFIEAAEGGWARNRSGRRYRPSALRDLRGILSHHVKHEIGEMPLRDVRRRHIQALIDRLAEEQLSESRIRSVVSAVRALYAYSIEQGHVEFSPADGLVIPRDGELRPAGSDDETAWDWTDDFTTPRVEAPAPTIQPQAQTQPSERPRDAGEYQPLALLPERILSLVLRIAVVVFLLFALFTIAESV